MGKFRQMIRFLLFARCCWRAYRRAGESGSTYSAVTSHGVPTMAVFVATGREAWRVSVRAAEEYRMLEP
jgi:hypothetical protein